MKPATAHLVSRVDSRLLAYSAVVGAAVAVSPAPRADASIIYVSLASTPIAIPITTAGVYINVVTGVSGSTPAAVPGWDLNPFGSISLSWFAANPTSSSGYVAGLGSSATLVDNLALGTLIGSSTIFATNGQSESTGATAFNFNSDSNYVGFRCLTETGTVCYGWVQIHLGATFTDPARSVIAYCYEDSGLGIPVGFVPEPGTLSTLGMMALGALGLRLWRRRARAV